LIYIPATLIVPGDAAATANKIASHEMLDYRNFSGLTMIYGAVMPL
jgi:hypothetical protein